LSNLIARPLTGNQIIQAFALAQGLYPTLSLQDWCRAVEHEWRQRGTELMSLQTVKGSIHALFFCREMEGLLHEATLQVDDIIVYDLPGRSRAMRTLLRVVEQMARERGCSIVDVTLPRARRGAGPAPHRFASSLAEAGYAEHGMRLRRSLEPAAMC
tara:strand:+ start:1573 stop:2043 length:471 start_codon:yes stop_codon:yes gene_type:complete